ncbi:hypothetical protein Prudu_018133 [Prunus dulcis]|uniref:Transmembrane protein n=1 Tax=Prunus dulcis TaxID=3755 RepID=A0A4Y1RQE1_PRUDU|nr:hypothetical protein Prudu_018133 [Prunus dulcis]
MTGLEGKSEVRHVMDHLGSRENDLDFDLESGETESTSEEDGNEGSGSDGNVPGKQWLGQGVASDGLSAGNNVSSIGQNMDMLASSMGQMAEGRMEKRTVEKQKKIPKKHPKPPRPPTGPSLHAADIEFVKEISKRSRLRRARRERMNALKKMKSDKTSSSKINFLAMIVTLSSAFLAILVFPISDDNVFPCSLAAECHGD